MWVFSQVTPLGALILFLTHFPIKHPIQNRHRENDRHSEFRMCVFTLTFRWLSSPNFLKTNVLTPCPAFHATQGDTTPCGELLPVKIPRSLRIFAIPAALSSPLSWSWTSASPPSISLACNSSLEMRKVANV